MNNNLENIRIILTMVFLFLFVTALVLLAYDALGN